MAARSSRGCRHRRRWPPDDVAQVLCQATCGTGRVLGQVQKIIQVGDQHSAGLYRPQYHGQAWHPTLVTAQPTPNVAPETNVGGNGQRSSSACGHATRSVVFSRRGPFPPVDGFAVGGHLIEEVSDDLDVCSTAAGPAEFPQLAGGSVIVVDPLAGTS